MIDTHGTTFQSVVARPPNHSRGLEPAPFQPPIPAIWDEKSRLQALCGALKIGLKCPGKRTDLIK
jgi:hypothetical protein